MPIETSNVGVIRPAGPAQKTEGSSSVQRSGGVSSGFAPETKVSLRTAIQDMAGVLSSIQGSEDEAVEKLPEDMRKVIDTIIRQSFSLEETLGQSLGSTLESQRFSTDQLRTFARMLSQLGSVLAKGGDAEASDTMQALLKNFKVLLEMEGDGTEPVLLNKASFALLDDQPMESLPTKMQQLFQALQQPYTQTVGKDISALQMLRQLVQAFMPQNSKASAGQQAAGQQAMPGQNTPAGQQAAPGQNAPVGQQAAPGQNIPTGQQTVPGQNPPAGQQAGPGQNAPTGQQAVPGQNAPTGQQAAPGQSAPAEQQATQRQSAPAGQQAVSGQNAPTGQQALPGQNAAGNNQAAGQGQPQAGALGQTAANNAQAGNGQQSVANQQAAANHAPQTGSNQQAVANNTPQGGSTQQAMANNAPQNGTTPQAAANAAPQNGTTPQAAANAAPQAGTNPANTQVALQGNAQQGNAQQGNAPQANAQQGSAMQPGAPMAEGNAVPQGTQNMPNSQGQPASNGFVQNPEYGQEQPFVARGFINGEGQFVPMRAQPANPQALNGQESLRVAMQQAREQLVNQPIENTPETMDTLRGLARMLLDHMELSPKDTALLNDFANSSHSVMPEKEARALQQLLRVVQHNVPAAVQQAAVQKDMPELPRLWSFMQLADMTAAKGMSSSRLKRVARDLSIFVNTMTQSMTGDPSQNPVQGQRSLHFIMPLYMGQPQIRYPAFVHVYDEKKPDPQRPGRIRKDTWFRVCVLTQNIGAVDATFRVYEGNQLDLRIYFSREENAQEFRNYMTNLRQSIRATTLQLKDVKISSI